MTQQHPINPPSELVKVWLRETKDDEPTYIQLAAKAAQWGADQELDACIAWMQRAGYWAPDGIAAPALRAARRPKPPSLKEEALIHFESYAATFETAGGDSDLILRALKQLPTLRSESDFNAHD